MLGMTRLELHVRLVTSGFAIPTFPITACPDEKSGRVLISGIMNHLVKPFVESDVLDSIDLALS